MGSVGSMGSMGAAVVCVGVAVWLLAGRRVGARRTRLVCAGGAVVGDAGSPPWRRLGEEVRRVRGRLGFEWWAAVAGLVLAVLGASVLPVVAGAVGVPLLRRVRLAREARRVRERRGDAVIALCSTVAGEVRAGRQPGEALVLAVREFEVAEAGGVDSGGPGSGGAKAGGGGVAGDGGPGFRGPEFGGLGDAQAAVLAAARFGGDVPGALAVAARRPGAEGLSGLAACWRVAVDQGAGLAAGLGRLEGALRAERDQRADLRAQLAGARSTAWMLAALPVLGLGLGAALGADPLHVLLHTGAGLGCLLVGGLLEGVGMWWAMRIVRGAEAA
ncbi:type II secretion system F family protein [Streptomyces sp. SID13726]|uniref:type II secretion system F family protein n=1 Tax=Streptomyces sp. SID13726 TaxID=2706058 RepID=UPI0013B6E334|nr:type II secretion system F family protein [Streptomyces sp. SID13726]NEB00643.1 hypothetical protein [Streptomyces sp. SID13726]